MLSDKSLKKLNLSEEQLKAYKMLMKKEEAFRDALKRCNIYPSAIEKIIAKSDLDIVNLNNIGELEENIKIEWSDFINEE